MTTPPYDPRTPLPDEFIADSQPEFLQNFGQLFDAFNLNHISLNDATDPGNHEVIQLFEQERGRETFSQEISIYSKKVANQTDQLFMRYPSNGKEIQLSQYQIYAIQATATQEAYFTFLPGGLLVYFGKAICIGKTEANISLNPSVCTNILGINLGGTGAQAPASNPPQPNVNVSGTPQAFTTIILKSDVPMINQYYLAFGNI